MLILNLEGKKIGFALTGSFCTFKNTIEQIKEIVKLGGDVLPIMSFNAYSINSKFGNAKDFIEEIKSITGKDIICTIENAEPIGPKKMTDCTRRDLSVPPGDKHFFTFCKKSLTFDGIFPIIMCVKAIRSP